VIGWDEGFGQVTIDGGPAVLIHRGEDKCGR
jgi:hypothetical protein